MSLHHAKDTDQVPRERYVILYWAIIQRDVVNPRSPYGIDIIMHVWCNSTSKVVTICHRLLKHMRSAVSVKSSKTPFIYWRNTLCYPTEPFLWYLSSIRWVTYDSCSLRRSWSRDSFSALNGAKRDSSSESHKTDCRSSGLYFISPVLEGNHCVTCIATLKELNHVLGIYICIYIYKTKLEF